MASSYYLLKKGPSKQMQPCTLHCGSLRVGIPVKRRGEKLKVDQRVDPHSRFADRGALGSMIAEHLYLTDYFPECNEKKPLSSFEETTVGITDILDMDCHCSTMLNVHSKNARVQELCGGINEAAQKLIDFKKHKPGWAVHGNYLLVSYHSEMRGDTEMRHEYLPLSETSLSNLIAKFKCKLVKGTPLSVPTAIRRAASFKLATSPKHAALSRRAASWRPAGSSGDSDQVTSLAVRTQPTFKPLIDKALADAHPRPSNPGVEQPARIEPHEAAAIAELIQATGIAEARLLVENTHDIEDVAPEQEQEQIYIIKFTRNPNEFEQCLHDGYELEAVRFHAQAKGENCRLKGGGSIFVHPEQYTQVRAQITANRLQLGPSHVVVSETYKQLVYGAVSRLRSRLNVKLKEEQLLTQVPKGAEELLFVGDSAKQVITVMNTFLCLTPHSIRMAQSVTQSTGDAHSIVNPRGLGPSSSSSF